MSYIDDFLNIWHVQLLEKCVEGSRPEGPEVGFSECGEVRALSQPAILLLDGLLDFQLPVFL